MSNKEGIYDNPYYDDNVYGHAVALLEKYIADTPSDVSGQSIHIDFGCGYGRIAEAIRDRLGLHYVGVDGALDGLTSLSGRGFETHRLDFSDIEVMKNCLDTLVGTRRVASISFLDTVEHLPNALDVLKVIRSVAKDQDAPLVISVPNGAHFDVGAKLVFGRWDYTDSGLLDHTHVRQFTSASFERFLQVSGLQTVDRNDVELVLSDQHFPAEHPALGSGSTLNGLLTELRKGIDKNIFTNQFCVLAVPGPFSAQVSHIDNQERQPERPFLSVVMRTQGRRIHCLIEAFTALAGQEDRDFEVVVIGHRLSAEQQKAVERAIDDFPLWLRERSRIVRIYDGNRTKPLNIGFENARGRYIAILDDDDVPMAHWVSTFKKLAQEKPGSVLRTVAARQEVDTVSIGDRIGVRATGGLLPYPSHFDLMRHLVTNESPPVGLAFPRGLFHDLNIRFDETLTTTEDWDYLLRAAIVVGVHHCDQVTAIYHWWTQSVESSRTIHNQEEWDSNYRAIHKKLDALPLLLPAGTARQLRHMITGGGGENPSQNPLPATADYQKKIAAILSSRCWRWTKPMRWPAMLRGRKDPNIRDCIEMNEAQLAALLTKLRRSGSWRGTAIFRGPDS